MILESANLSELRKVHNQELEALDKTLKDAEASLSVSFLFCFFKSSYNRTVAYFVMVCSDFVVLYIHRVKLRS